MKLNINQLAKQLQTELSAVYIVAGDEPLLCMEAADAIRTAAREAGYSERQLFNVETNFDWSVLYDEAASMSLFAEKRILEFRLKTASLSDKGEALLSYLANPPQDTLLLISAPKLDVKTKWVKTVTDSPLCQLIQIWPIEANQLPQWIRQRLATLGLSITPDALELFSLRVEGNLLAAAQEIEKLKLLIGNDSRVDVDHIQQMVVDSARFDIFGLVDIALQGDATHSLRMLQGLRAEGAAETLVLWTLTKELRALMTLAQLAAQGIPLQKAFSQVRPPIWSKRQAIFQQAIGRYSANQWGELLIKAQQVDAQIKGQAAGDCWQGLTDILLAMAGKPLRIS
ncbi:DNA polymerase III subunit delta [Entomomonas asaccharolytica]|uniref:DNA polymerase III subunit delta n=1 Tax=Entomomonas asaccharolytica TaxID=2785331 RepID=A0A974NED2_9GAMM|nr:DNA polymerase III subunit delta [Entomomonas asaccharolytica]QQP84927.1 DNA polymerase III subunit delta [Entomomonas asaccharolytica]